MPWLQGDHTRYQVGSTLRLRLVAFSTNGLIEAAERVLTIVSPCAASSEGLRWCPDLDRCARDCEAEASLRAMGSADEAQKAAVVRPLLQDKRNTSDSRVANTYSMHVFA